MKSIYGSFVAFCLASAIAASDAGAVAPPTAFTYQGQLRFGGIPVTDEAAMAFSLWDAAEGGRRIAPIVELRMPVVNGLFSVDLDFGIEPFRGEPLWLEVELRTSQGGAVLRPRQMIRPTPLALFAIAGNPGPAGTAGLSCWDLDGDRVKDPNEDRNGDGVHDALDCQGAGGDSVWSVNTENEAYYTRGNLGIGTDNPNVLLDIGGNANKSLLVTRNTNTGLDARGIEGEAVYGTGVTGKGSIVGVRGETAGQSGIGVMGVASDPAGQNRGVLGQSFSTLGYGVSGTNNHATGTGAGVYGMALSPNAWAGKFDGRCNVSKSVHVGNDAVVIRGEANIGLDVNTAAGNRAKISAGGATDGAALTLNDGDGTLTLGLRANAPKLGTPTERTAAAGLDLYDGSGMLMAALRGRDDYGSGGRLRIFDTDGDLGAELSGGQLTLSGLTGNSNVDSIIMAAVSTGPIVVMRNGAGENAIVLAAEAVGGRSRITTDEVLIRGGADLSEQFDVASSNETPAPGNVVCIDKDNPGKLVVCGRAYDKTVAGIVSGAGGIRPGMLMGQERSAASGTYPVALTGRVYCKADAATGRIEPGDLLTSSDRPGYAMKVTDHAAAIGSVLGKAMSSLEDGEGLVLVLVSLQ